MLATAYRLNGETPRPECDSTATVKERERESGATGSNETTGLKPNGGLEVDRTKGNDSISAANLR